MTTIGFDGLKYAEDQFRTIIDFHNLGYAEEIALSNSMKLKR